MSEKKPSADSISVEVTDTPGETTVADAKTAVVIDRQGNRAWSSTGKDASEATTRAVRSFVGDRRANEYVPR